MCSMGYEHDVWWGGSGKSQASHRVVLGRVCALELTVIGPSSRSADRFPSIHRFSGSCSIQMTYRWIEPSEISPEIHWES